MHSNGTTPCMSRKALLVRQIGCRRRFGSLGIVVMKLVLRFVGLIRSLRHKGGDRSSGGG